MVKSIKLFFAIQVIALFVLASVAPAQEAGNEPQTADTEQAAPASEGAAEEAAPTEEQPAQASEEPAAAEAADMTEAPAEEPAAAEPAAMNEASANEPMAPSAPMAYLDARLTTTVRSYEDVSVDPSADKMTYMPIYQYLRLNAYNIGGSKDMYFLSYLRFNFTGSSEEDQSRGKKQMRILYANFNWNNIADMIDLGVGRQYSIEGLGFYDYDGINLFVHDIGPVAIGIHAGNAVEPEGSEEAAASVMGLRVELYDFKDIQAAISTTKETRDGETIGDKLGVDLSYTFLDDYRVYFNQQQNNLLDQVDDQQVGIGMKFMERHLDVEVDQYTYTPNFDGDSIFNVFNLEPFTSQRVRISWRDYDMLKIYTRIEQKAYTDAGDGYETNSESVTALGGSFYADAFTVNGEMSSTDGLAGKESALDLSGEYYLMQRELTLGAGVNQITYENQFSHEDDLSQGLRFSTRYRSRTTDLWDVYVLGEQYTNGRFKSQSRLTATLNIYFGAEI